MSGHVVSPETQELLRLIAYMSTRFEQFPAMFQEACREREEIPAALMACWANGESWAIDLCETSQCQQIYP